MAQAREKTNADLEPVLWNGLRPPLASVTFEKAVAALRSNSPAAIWVLREIFSFPSFEEIFDGHFRRDFGRVPDKAGAGGVNSKPTLWIFSWRELRPASLIE
jgi:hypothetical protein